jgi:hypothetical protein
VEKSWVYISIATITILIMTLLAIFLIEITAIVTLGNRVENSLIASGWAGFSAIDLSIASDRADLGDLESRGLYLDKTKAEVAVRQYIRENLGLDINYIPTALSYIPDKENPVLIDEIKIFNPDELPVIENGINITRTTIKISIQIPMKIKGIGLKYARKNVLVNIDSFI